MADEVRLVSLEYALGQLEMGEREYGENFATDSSHVRDFLKALPVVEVVSAVHGRWIYANDEWVCSKCGEPALQSVEFSRGCYMGCETVESNFCPHCGARMNAEGEGNV